MNKNSIQNFKQLHVWKKSYQLALSIYKVSQSFPSEEKFGLTSQLRRASISISSNIAEGFSRETFRDKLKFYSIARGSLTEVESQILVSHGLGFIDRGTLEKIQKEIDTTGKILTGLIRATRKRV